MSEFTKCPNGCKYEGKFGQLVCCEYIFYEGHSRGCKGGRDCEKYVPAPGVKKRRQALPDFNRKTAKEPAPWWEEAEILLTHDMMSDTAIAEKIGVSTYVIMGWRKRKNLPSGRELKRERVLEVASKVREFRLAHGWSQPQFAMRLGVSTAGVQKWEQGVCFAPENIRRMVGSKW